MSGHRILAGILFVAVFIITAPFTYSQTIRPITLSPELSGQQTVQQPQQNTMTRQPQQQVSSYQYQNTTVANSSVIPTYSNMPSQLPEIKNPTQTPQIEPYYTNWNSQEAYNEINRLGEKILNANNMYGRISFSVINQDIANANTNINNEIKVYKGLLKYVESEDELAAVLGHELGHVQGNDVAQLYGRKVVTNSIEQAGRMMYSYGTSSTVRTIGRLVQLGTSIGGDMVNNKIDRNDEYAADKASVDLLVKAGYNPLAEISILNKICGNYFDFFYDHPSGEKRLVAIYKYVQEKYPEYIEQGYPTVSYQRALKFINYPVAYQEKK